VREAFGLLAAEGLIVVVPKRGSFVSQLSVDDILEIYQIRMPLECMAARVAAQTLDEAGLATLQRLVKTEAGRTATRRPQDSLKASAQFHDVIIGCLHNKRLTTLLNQLQGQVHRARALWPSTVSRLSETWQELDALLKALQARDPDEAERRMRDHLEKARQATLARMMPIDR
jgi:DNA-binding GntR family transcriptional regulator